MTEKGLKPAADEERLFNFMTKRAEAFDRNELDPEIMSRLVEGLEISKNRDKNKKQLKPQAMPRPRR